MKRITTHSIINIPGTDPREAIFEMPYVQDISFPEDIEHISLALELQKYKNEEIQQRVKEKPAMYSEVYSPKDELRIFEKHFERALKENKKIHISWITLAEELVLVESYYQELGFVREDINAFDVDFSLPLVTVSCHIENLMWRGSDYKAMWDKIFFCPPVRESGQNKALFKWITRWVIAGIEIGNMTVEKESFIKDCVLQEKILLIHMAKVLYYNYKQIAVSGDEGKVHINF